MRYERADLLIGILLVIVGAVAIMAFAAATFAGHPEFGNFRDAGAVAAGLDKYAGHVAGVFFAIVVLAAALVLAPGTPLGLLTNAVQALAGVLLPSAIVFLLLLCNDTGVLGPWVNGRLLNVFTGAVIAVLVMLSIVLTASVLFPSMGERAILAILGGGTAFTLAIAAALLVVRREDRALWTDSFGRMIWRMPPLDRLPPARITPLTRLWLAVLRCYLLIAGGLVLWRIVQLATGG
jgi:Natural resistance-associated macrophage protein